MASLHETNIVDELLTTANSDPRYIFLSGHIVCVGCAGACMCRLWPSLSWYLWLTLGLSCRRSTTHSTWRLENHCWTSTYSVCCSTGSKHWVRTVRVISCWCLPSNVSSLFAGRFSALSSALNAESIWQCLESSWGPRWSTVTRCSIIKRQLVCQIISCVVGQQKRET